MEQERISNRLRVIELAKQLGNVSEACRQTGTPRSSFYELKKAYEENGEAALLPKPRKKPKMPHAFSSETVQKILDTTRKFPSYSYNRIASKLQGEGLTVRGGGVRRVWERAGLCRKDDRYRWISEQEGRTEAPKSQSSAVDTGAPASL